MLFTKHVRSPLVLDVESDEHKVLEAKVPCDCSKGEGRQLQHAAISELDVVNATAAAGGSMRIFVDQLEDGGGLRQSCSDDRRLPSAFEFQESSLEVVKTIELAQ